MHAWLRLTRVLIMHSRAHKMRQQSIQEPLNYFASLGGLSYLRALSFGCNEVNLRPASPYLHFPLFGTTVLGCSFCHNEFSSHATLRSLKRETNFFEGSEFRVTGEQQYENRDERPFPNLKLGIEGGKPSVANKSTARNLLPESKCAPRAEESYPLGFNEHLTDWIDRPSLLQYASKRQIRDPQNSEFQPWPSRF